MKCPNCWSRKIDDKGISVFHKFAAAFLLMSPVKCRHCFHRFHKAIWTSLPPAESSEPHQEILDAEDDASILPFPQNDEKSVPEKVSSIPLRNAA